MEFFEEYIELIMLMGFLVFIFIVDFIYNNNNKSSQINFDEFDDIEKIKQQDTNSKEEMKYESEVLKQVYRDSYDNTMFNLTLDSMNNKGQDFFSEHSYDYQQQQAHYNAEIDVEKVKRDLYNFKVIDAVKSEKDNIKEANPINALRRNGYNFDVKLFKKWSRQIFACIKSGSEEELKIVKNFISEELYDKLEYQRKQFAKDGLEFITADLLIEKCYLCDYSRSLHKEEIKVLINATMIEYIINKNTNEIVRGSDYISYNKNIIMTFNKENKNDEEGLIHNCPNCGAEVTQTEFGKCRYCNTLVIPIRYNWTLTKFETI